MVGIPKVVVSILLAYFIGSIPNAYWFGKIFKGIDIRNFGSGNVGATNALRILGKPLGFTILILDIGKGWLAVQIARWIFQIQLDWLLVIIGLIAVFGHIYTIFLRFKGGKGVATTFGVFLALTPLATFFAMLVFGIVVLLSRYASLASIISAFTFPFFIFLTNTNRVYTSLGILLGLVIIIRHKTNIRRLIKGTENRISFPGKAK